jgi:hypothetical protein
VDPDKLSGPTTRSQQLSLNTEAVIEKARQLSPTWDTR